MYAIQNIRTKKFVYGTDYRYSPPHQKTSHNQMLTYSNLKYAMMEFMNVRKCGQDYRVVKLEPVKVGMVFDFDTGYEYIPELQKWSDEDEQVH